MIATGRPARIAVMVGLALATASCSSSDDGEPSNASSETTASTAETTTSSEPTTTVGVPCPDLAAPSGVESVSSASGDVDGDGREDELETYRRGDEWHLRTSLAAGGATDLVLTVRSGEQVEVLGGADVDGDGADEPWARVGAGASATILGLARFHDCQLEQVRFAGGEPAELPVGGSVGSPAGLTCDQQEADLVAYTALLGDDDVYDVTVTPYRLDGGELVAGEPSTTTVRADDDDFFRYASFTCEGLSL